MKQFLVRGVVTLGLVTSLGLGVSGVASAGSGPSRGGSAATSSALKTYQRQLTAYRASRSAIEATFRANVQTANSTYEQALSTATTSAQRSAAEQTKVTAIINAAATRSSALIALGNGPTPPSN